MHLPDPSAVPERLPGGDESSLDVMARLLLDAVDGRTSVADLGDTCGIDVDLVCRIAADLAQRGVLAVPGFEPPSTGPSAPSEPASRAGAGANAGEMPDLPAEVERHFHGIRQWNFYEVLGVAPDADRKGVRAAYFTLSKKFHPDRAFGADTADLHKKMEVIFRRLTQAYEVLSNAAQRAEYDEYIADQISVWKMERQLLRALGQEDEPEEEGRPADPPPRDSQAPSPLCEETRPATPPSTPPVARPEHDSKRRAWQRERAQRMLRQALGGEAGGASAPTKRPRPDEIEDCISRGSLALEAGACAEAVRVFTDLLDRDPGNVRAAALLADAKVRATRDLAAGYLRQGRYERLQGDFERARATLYKAIEIDPANLEARHQLADLLFTARRDLSQALTLSREVVVRGGQKARYFAILGELLLLAKDVDRARESFSRAVQQEPDNKEYRKRLKACGG